MNEEKTTRCQIKKNRAKQTKNKENRKDPIFRYYTQKKFLQFR